MLLSHLLPHVHPVLGHSSKIHETPYINSRIVSKLEQSSGDRSLSVILPSTEGGGGDFPKDGLNLFKYLQGTVEIMKERVVNIAENHSTITPKSADCVNGSTVISGCRNVAFAACERPRKKRKVDDLVKGSYTRVQIPIARAPDIPEIGGTSFLSQEESWECKSCIRRFKSEQGVKTHVYMYHVLGEPSAQSSCGTSPNSYSTGALSCDICQKGFPNQDAIHQHRIAKHSGQFQSIKPSWATVLDVKEAFDGTHTLLSGEECMICGLRFPSNEELGVHLLGWQPITLSKIFSCLQCTRSFGDDRSLKQHMNYCKISSEKLLTIP